MERFIFVELQIFSYGVMVYAMHAYPQEDHGFDVIQDDAYDVYYCTIIFYNLVEEMHNGSKYLNDFKTLFLSKVMPGER